ncbi:MAG: hypothetical protein LBI94_07490 [Treponema sp.]|nr:hypothetical protein [Treponema sp.]
MAFRPFDTPIFYDFDGNEGIFLLHLSPCLIIHRRRLPGNPDVVQGIGGGCRRDSAGVGVAEATAVRRSSPAAPDEEAGVKGGRRENVLLRISGPGNSPPL